ncbi:hypothetical protein SELMODRAFT_98932 [Selaginella moellendorffii]|uniref:Uncharacterized protein n=1 Tax=Selaginella moellendorffii TaxID=88036 RepID=D8RQL4_SELML|nr:uncharacterized protein LOC9637773 [Selaginella moellendorffii]EFJ22277.1 hypothetical protein SELMODRAFT_105350 [Selaginella moellendorffii]EFJ25670.1 hypothetical protein SELMODRAFT_98932 [Selaginella moellendorffii]|eukprot:XP_002973296.1 uncharacterized protein LOC9637773 [Selaginella moellendorffii]
MWWEISLRRDVIVHPRHMDPSGGHRRWIIQTLLEDMEDLQCSREHGYYVAPTTLSKVSGGMIRESGGVSYKVDFKCMVFKLIKNEIVELEIENVKQSGAEASCGPYTAIFLHHSLMTGFVYSNENGPCFKNSDGVVISKGCAVRAKILGGQFMGDGFRCLATINDAHLGVINPEG